jgi:ABC-type transporter Mla MlaB component
MDTLYRIVFEPHPAESSITLLLNGKFSEDAIPDLDHSITQAKDAHQRVYIDLSEVTLVDRRAVDYFSEQAARDIKLVNCPGYLRRWIGQVSDEAEA